MKLIVLIAVLNVITVSAFAQIGGLDTTFGEQGKVTTLVTYTSFGSAMALLPNGKIIVAGSASNGSTYEFALARYTSDGVLDTTFGLEGIDTTRVRSGNSIATSVAIQSDGKIVVAGYSSNNDTIKKADSTVRFAIVRYDSAGIIDSTFGTNGIVTDSIGSVDDEANAVVIQPDGKIIVGGLSNYAKGKIYSEFALIRLNTDGSLDTSFNKTGMVLTSLNIYNDRGYALSLQKSGKILLGGWSSNGSSWNFAIVRYKANGDTDNSFNGTSHVTLDFSGGNDIIYSIAILPSGKLILGGVTIHSKISAFAMAELDSAGKVDSSFGINGQLTTSIFGQTDVIRALAIDSAQRIVAAGYTYNEPYTAYDFALIRYDTLGNIDTTFGDTGKTVIGFGGANSYCNAMAIQPDGKILVAGYADDAPKSQFALARFNIKVIILGIVDLATENNSMLVYPDPVESDATLKFTLQNNEKLTINLYDITGRLIQSIITNQNLTAGDYTESLNMQNLPSGIYIVNLTDDASQSLSIKVVKQ